MAKKAMVKKVMVNENQLQQLIEAVLKAGELAEEIHSEFEYGPDRIEYGLLDSEYHYWWIGGRTFQDVPMPEGEPFKSLAAAKAAAKKLAKKEGVEVSEHKGNFITGPE